MDEDKKEKSTRSPVETVVTYLALVLQHFGGEVTIPFDEIESGLPAQHGVHMEQLANGDLYMAIREVKDEH